METDKPKIHPPKHAERDEIVNKEDEGENEVQLDMEMDQEEDNENEDKVINVGVVEGDINKAIEDEGGSYVYIDNVM